MDAGTANATYTVVDVETTGLNHAVDAVVEIAYVKIVAGVIVERFATLLDPGRPIPKAASAVHGITDRHVIGSPTLVAVEQHLRRACDDAVVVAHNAAFDLRFLAAVAHRPSVCTMRLGMHLVDAPNYRNETLFRYLCVDETKTIGAAHRALADAEMTAHVLLRLLAFYRGAHHPDTVGDLIALTRSPARLRRIGFGPHRGRRFTQLPSSYLAQLCASDRIWRDTRHSARMELQRRGPTIPADAIR